MGSASSAPAPAVTACRPGADRCVMTPRLLGFRPSPLAAVGWQISHDGIAPGISTRRKIARRVVPYFTDPHGLGGSAAGWIMAHRSSNVRRSRWAVGLLDVQPTDQVLEIGFG